MILIQNIFDNFRNLRTDFIGISINLQGVFEFFINIIIASATILIYFSFGEKIRRRFFSNNTDFRIFVSILLGYGIIGSGLAILGILSLLNSSVLLGYFSLIFAIALFPGFINFKKRL